MPSEMRALNASASKRYVQQVVQLLKLCPNSATETIPECLTTWRICPQTPLVLVSEVCCASGCRV